MLRRFALLTVALALVAGCASKTTTEEWRQYARGAYLQGVAVGKADISCRPVVIQAQSQPGQVVYGPTIPFGQVVPYGQAIPTATVGVAPGTQEYCNQAKADAAAITEVSKQADYDLTNNKPERQRTLNRYIELGGKVAQ